MPSPSTSSNRKSPHCPSISYLYTFDHFDISCYVDKTNNFTVLNNVFGEYFTHSCKENTLEPSLPLNQERERQFANLFINPNLNYTKGPPCSYNKPKVYKHCKMSCGLNYLFLKIKLRL